MATYDPERFRSYKERQREARALEREQSKKQHTRPVLHIPVDVPYVVIVTKKLRPFERQPSEPHIVFTHAVPGLRLGDWSGIEKGEQPCHE